MNISEHFLHNEFFQGDKSGDVSFCDMVKARFVAFTILEPARISVNNPIWINSGKRSINHNKVVGGSSASEHLWKEESAAIDIDTRDSTLNRKLFLWLYRNKNEMLGQLISYFDAANNTRFIHLSMVSNRHLEFQAMTATYEKINGKRNYFPFSL